MWLPILWKAGIRGIFAADLTDNRVTLSVWGKGRASPWPLCRQSRKRASWEAATGNRLATSWSATYVMPADEGTRDETVGALNQEIVPLSPPAGFVFDFSGDALRQQLIRSFTSATVVSPSWDMATIRGRGPLGAAILGGDIWTCLWGVFQDWEGDFCVHVPQSKRKHTDAMRHNYKWVVSDN